MDALPFSQAAENTQRPILSQLERLLADCSSALEIGAGTGQHAVAFASALSHLRWQPTEHPAAMVNLRPRCQAAGLDNLAEPVPLDLAEHRWPVDWPDAVYTANTLHIVSIDLVQGLFATCREQGSKNSLLLVYGPFNYGGQYTSPSNESFDAWLKDRDERSGIRDFEWVHELARDAGYGLREDIAMPANNRLVCWEKTEL